MAITGLANPLEVLVGKNVTRIRWNHELLVFDTDDGQIAFRVSGDCCSSSYYHDFYGVAWLLNNGPVTKVQVVDLPEDEKTEAECTDCYGFQLFTEHPTWGEVTSVFSFRNDSDGYYGGWMEAVTYRLGEKEITDLVELEKDDIGQ